MKNISIYLILILLSTNIIFAQETLILQPGPIKGKDAILHGLESHANINHGDHVQYVGMSWTFDGIPGDIRSAMEFDLSSIPQNALISKARLNLYAYDSQNNLGQHSTLSGSNECWIQRITTEWDENKVTWNTQPYTTNQNQISLASSSYLTQDYLDIDVTQLVQDMIIDPTNSHGFLIRLKEESYYRRLNFASSDHPNELLRPKLVVVYSEQIPNDSCYVIQPSAEKGKDAVLHGLESHANMNHGDHPQIPAMAWTFNGIPGNLRGLIEFELPTLENNLEISGAYLSLYAYDADNSLGQHSTLNGPNNSYIQRVITDWEEDKVTWNTQPKTTTENQVELNSSSYPDENYLDIDVTQLIKDMVDNPNESFGFMIKLKKESYYRKLNFASSDHSNYALHPKLELCYNPRDVTVPEIDIQQIDVFPNPAKTDIYISLTIPDNIESFKIYNTQGQIIYAVQKPNSLTQLNIKSWSKGLYIIKFFSDDHTIIKKFVIN